MKKTMRKTKIKIRCWLCCDDCGDQYPMDALKQYPFTTALICPKCWQEIEQERRMAA